MLDELLTFTQETAVSAGKLTQEKWLTPLQISEKGYHDLVTDADIAAQALITQKIKDAYPTHGFLTEEDDDTLPTNGDLIWIIDPIDGTTNYSRLQPQYAVSIGVGKPIFNDQGQLVNYDMLVGVIYDPGRDELFSAAKGKGAWLNGRLLKTSNQAELEHALICMDLSLNKRTNRSTKDFIVSLSNKTHGVRILGSAAIGFAWVAAGRFEANMNFSLKPWDVAAGLLLILEAGGSFSNEAGNPIKWDERGMDCVGSNGRIHQELLQAIQ